MQQEHQAGTLPKLVLDRAPSTDLVAVSNETRGEIEAIRAGRGPGIMGTHLQEFSSYPSEVPTDYHKVASANPGVICEMQH